MVVVVVVKFSPSSPLKNFSSIPANSSFSLIPSHHPSFLPFKNATGNCGVSFPPLAVCICALFNHLVPEKFRCCATSAFRNPNMPSSAYVYSVTAAIVTIASRLLPHDAAATVMQVLTPSLHALSHMSISLCRCGFCLYSRLYSRLAAGLAVCRGLNRRCGGV